MDKGKLYRNVKIKNDNYNLQEKYLWFLGKEDYLADFYQTQTNNESLYYDTREEYYYSKVGENIRAVHSGIPSLISYSKSRLLTSGGVKLSVVDNKNNELESETKLLNEIVKDNNLIKIIKKSIVTQSWGGKVAWKISYDSNISEYPIVELYNPLEYKSFLKRGRLDKIVFPKEYEKSKNKYCLEEEYTKGGIFYYLYEIDGDKKIPVPLDELEETKDLKDVTFKDKTMILAGECTEEKSDYDGLISEFDALDEAWSQLMDEIRLGRSEVYVPEILLTNRTFDKFRKNYAVLGSDMRENATNKIDHIQPDIRPEQYATTINVITNNILINVGLNAFTVGIDDGIGANSSGEALAKREANSLRTRKEMVENWESFLDEMIYKLMYAYYNFKKKHFNKNIQGKTTFGEYITPSREEIINQIKLLVDSNIIDTEKALEEVYNDIDEEEKLRILANTGNLSIPNDPIPDDEGI